MNSKLTFADIRKTFFKDIEHNHVYSDEELIKESNFYKFAHWLTNKKTKTFILNNILWERPLGQQFSLANKKYWLETKLSEIESMINKQFITNLEMQLENKINKINIIEGPKGDFLLNDLVTIEIMDGIELYRDSLGKKGKSTGYLTSKDKIIGNANASVIGIPYWNKSILFDVYNYFYLTSFYKENNLITETKIDEFIFGEKLKNYE